SLRPLHALWSWKPRRALRQARPAHKARAQKRDLRPRTRAGSPNCMGTIPDASIIAPRPRAIVQGTQSMRRVVVTGLGMVSPCGNDGESSWNAALEGRTGVARIARFDPAKLTVHIAAEVKGFEIGDAMDFKEAKRASRFVQYAVKAARE